MIICLLLVIESLTNGVFFAEGSSTGLIGGVIQAIVLSFLNIGAGLLFAFYLLPYAHHRRGTVKAGGILAVVCYIIWVLTLNIGIGHFRDLFARQEGHVSMAQLWSHLTAGLFAFADARSLILVGLGIAFSLVAVIEATGLDDPYPGYGALGRRSSEAITDYGDHRNRCLQDLRARRDEAIDAMSRVIEEVRGKEHELGLSINGRNRLHQQYAGFIEHLNQAQARLLQRYP